VNTEQKNEECLHYLNRLSFPEQHETWGFKELGYRLHSMELCTITLKIANCMKAINHGSAINIVNQALLFLEARYQNTSNQATTLDEESYRQAELVLKTYLATLKFESGIHEEAKAILTEGDYYIKTRKAAFEGVDSELYRQHYYLALLYYSTEPFMDAQNFLDSALYYLSYKPLNEIETKVQMGLARSITHAAIFSDDTFNFGKVLFHPIMDCLKGTDHQDLIELLKAFDDGNYEKFMQYKNVLDENGQPLTEVREQKLQRKMRIMALMVMCWKLEPTQRVVNFRRIATACRVDESQVEFALMAAMSRGLIEGKINQVRQEVNITKVQARDIDQSGVEQLLTKVNSWMDQILDIKTFVEENAQSFV